MGAIRPKKPGIEDLKGSSSLYQDPECVIMLTSPEDGQIDVDVIKNKGKMGFKTYAFNQETGRVGGEVTTAAMKAEKEFGDW